MAAEDTEFWPMSWSTIQCNMITHMSTTNQRAAPLTGVSVVDLTRYVPGPFCTLQLAWLGAEVTVVEQPPGGDGLRTFPPYGANGTGAAFSSLAREKNHVLLDLTDDDAKTQLRQMIADADVVIEGFRPGVMARLGFEAQDILSTRPDLVWCSISGWGQTGEWRDLAGHDANFLAASGLLAQCPSGTLPPVPLSDIMAGSLAATAICAALFGRSKKTDDDQGTLIDLAIAEAALSMQTHHLIETQLDETEAANGAGLLTGGLASYSVWKCADGRYVAAAPVEPKFFARVCRELGCEDLSDKQFIRECQPEIAARFAESFAKHPAQYWEEKFLDIDACVFRVRGPHEVSGGKQFMQRGALAKMPEVDPAAVTPASPFVFNGVRLNGEAG